MRIKTFHARKLQNNKCEIMSSILQAPVDSITMGCMVWTAKTWNGYTAPVCSLCECVSECVRLSPSGLFASQLRLFDHVW